MGEGEIDLADYLQIISKRKWLIIGALLVCIIIASIVSFNLPSVYQATVTIRNGSITTGTWIPGEGFFMETPIIDREEIEEFFRRADILGSIVNKLKLTISKEINEIHPDKCKRP